MGTTARAKSHSKCFLESSTKRIEVYLTFGEYRKMISISVIHAHFLACGKSGFGKKVLPLHIE